MRRILDVTASAGSYPLCCGQDAAAALAEIWQPAWRQVAIVGDSNTLPLFGERLAAALRARTRTQLALEFPAGDQHKTRASKARLEDAMLAAGLDRDCCVLAVGGGVVLDLAGFVAATYQRGVAHVNLATSLLAQVDAAIGGKTGVNTAAGKNLVGAFHPPRAVLLDTAALRSLPAAEVRCGLAEMVKYGVIADGRLFADLEAWAGQQQQPQPHDQRQPPPPALPPDDLIVRCALAKVEVVQADELEAGRRRVLNFGHTVAHAIEAATGHAVGHGQAVAAGMVIEARLAETLCGFPPAESRRMVELLRRLGLPTAPPCDFQAARPFLARDKKASAGEVHAALPRRLGEMEAAAGRYSLPVPLPLLGQIWAAAATQVETQCSS